MNVTSAVPSTLKLRESSCIVDYYFGGPGQTLCWEGKGLVSSRTRSCAGDTILSRPIRSLLHST